MAAETTSVSVSYILIPPEGTSAPPSLTQNGTHAFVVEADKTGSDLGAYYEAVRKSIAAAREKIGEELTAWRDAVGSTELGKEKAVKATREEDNDEEEDEEQVV